MTAGRRLAQILTVPDGEPASRLKGVTPAGGERLEAQHAMPDLDDTQKPLVTLS